MWRHGQRHRRPAACVAARAMGRVTGARAPQTSSRIVRSHASSSHSISRSSAATDRAREPRRQLPADAVSDCSGGRIFEFWAHGLPAPDRVVAALSRCDERGRRDWYSNVNDVKTATRAAHRSYGIRERPSPSRHFGAPRWRHVEWSPQRHARALWNHGELVIAGARLPACLRPAGAGDPARPARGARPPSTTCSAR